MTAKRKALERCPFTYSNLVDAYFREAVLCRDSGCSFAAIGVLWAAVEYAIEHQLWGGNLINPKTLDYMREPVEFDSRQMKKKLEVFFELYPSLREKWETRLFEMYGRYRNTFLHAKLDNLSVSTLLETQIRPAAGTREAKKLPRKDRTVAEVGLISLAPEAANQMFLDVKLFLGELNREVYPTARRLGGV